MINNKGRLHDRLRIWKPLSLVTLAGLTPPEWEVKLLDENIKFPDYVQLPKPDFVGITAFTSQAVQAYKIAAIFRAQNVPVIMGGIHASMCSAEALSYVDSVFKGEAEELWASVLEDVKNGKLKTVYEGNLVNLENIPPARHSVCGKIYALGAIQTTRGCPLSCDFCSVSLFNGKKYRFRPIARVVEELKMIQEKVVLIVDDNFTGTTKKHLERAKELLRAILGAKIKKKYIIQVTINFANDDELLSLAKKAGIIGLFIGFESTSEEGLKEIKKEYYLKYFQDYNQALKRLHKYGMMVVGSFIIGLDCHKQDIGVEIARKADYYGVDIMVPLFLTPLPGTPLANKIKQEERMALCNFPEDWKYFTLAMPAINYMHLSWQEMFKEFEQSFKYFYSMPRILFRIFAGLLTNGSFFNFFVLLFLSLSYKVNSKTKQNQYAKLNPDRGISVIRSLLVDLPESPGTNVLTKQTL